MRKYFLPAASAFLLLVIWKLAVGVFDIQAYILPEPEKIIRALFEDRQVLFAHGLQTAIEALSGFLLAIFAGLFLALLMARYSSVKEALYPFVIISQTIPVMAMAPILIIWFGYGLLPKIVVVGLVCFFPVTVSLVEGMAKVDPDVIKLLQAMGASESQILRKVRLPAVIPALFAGIKISAAYSIMGAVIAEWLGASKGLGIYLMRSMHSFRTERVFAAILVISVLSLLVFAAVEVISRLVMPWQYRYSSSKNPMEDEIMTKSNSED